MTTRIELLQDVDEWLARDDITEGASGPTLLRIAQAIINRRVRVRAQETIDTLSATTRVTALPADLISLRSLTLQSSDNRSIDFMTPERIRESAIWLNQGGSASGIDTPAQAYSIEGLNVVLAPEPSAVAVVMDIVYFARFADLVADDDTNWLLTNAYDIYLYAILMATGIYLEDDEIEDKYERRLEKALEELRLSERRARFSGSALISTGNPRSTV